MYIAGITEEDYLGKKDQQKSNVKAFVKKLEQRDTASLMRNVYSVKRDTSHEQRAAVSA